MGDLITFLTPQLRCPYLCKVSPPKCILSLSCPLTLLQPVGPSRVHCQPCCQQRSANPSGNPSEGWLFSHCEPEMKGTFCLPFPPGPSWAVQRGSPQCPSGLVQSHLKGWERRGCSAHNLQLLLVTAGSRSRGLGPQHWRWCQHIPLRF